MEIATWEKNRRSLHGTSRLARPLVGYAVRDSVTGFNVRVSWGVYTFTGRVTG